jgi:hypothetical protein
MLAKMTFTWHLFQDVAILCFPSQTSVEFPSNSQSETSFWSTKKVPFWLTAFWALSPGVPLWSQWSSASPRVSAALAVDVFARMQMLPSGYVKIAIENGHRNSEFSH